ncbi:MAG: DUF2905 domain-containing protein [Candidatus Omnitrophica bacterium]|nr:DUF2905 domain-containing protein [Candidatus Omnitrophota bacterium]MBU1932862.1 DUF2905 domain-containing protein [Candidatus Omnitrophota bacterium]
MNALGRFLILAGIILIIAGLVFSFAGKIPWIGKLPGDIYIKRENVSFYFPVTTSILLSIVISLILFFIGRRQ